jgi:hypothetical protein
VSNSALSQLDSSDTLDRGIRAGLVAYGVVHLIIAALGVQLALVGDGSGSASKSGAFAELAESGTGQAVLWVMALGFAALVIWQALEAAVGDRQAPGREQIMHRVSAAGRAVLYAVLAVGAASRAIGGGGSSGGSSSKSSSDSLTARLMSAPGGVLLVGAVGLGVIAVAAVLVHRGWTEGFTKHLDAAAAKGERRRPILLLGKAGYIAKGVALATIGFLFLVAAAKHDPQESGGLDVALHELLRQPFGVAIAGAVALGLGCFGLYCFAWARHLKR